MNDCAEALRVEKPRREQQKPRARSRTGLLKFLARADLLICFIVIPVGTFMVRLWGIKPITIPLVGLAGVFVMACMRALRNPG
jgi:hypothetical protein